jgi:hypothetical protein
VHLESHCALIKGDRSDVHRPEPIYRNFIHKHFLQTTFRKSLCTYKRCRKWCPWAMTQAWTKSTYHRLSAQRLSKRTVEFAITQYWIFSLKKIPLLLFFSLLLPKVCVWCLLLTDTKIHPVIAKLFWRSDLYINRICYLFSLYICLTFLVPPDFGGASEKCQGEF